MGNIVFVIYRPARQVLAAGMRTTVTGGGGTGAVDSVNGQTGTVVLDADDIAEGATNHYYPQADETKLVGIETGAQVNVGTDLSISYNPAYVFVNSSTGTDATLAGATDTAAGVMSSADKVKLDGIATGATQNSSDAFLRARGNHTGTQLASTVSDFALTTLATLMAGFTLIAGGTVLAADSLLVAVGKLQKQINDLFSGKQDTLVSATNIKTINGASILGAGDLTVGGMSNPMTTAGDIIVGGASGAPTRLAKGTDGQMLLMAAGVQAYGNNPILAGYKETLETMANNAIDVSTSNVKKRVLTANTTFTITGATSGFSHTMTLHIEGGNTYSVTWPASFKWLVPIPTLTAKHVISGYTIDGGTTWLINYAESYV